MSCVEPVMTTRARRAVELLTEKPRTVSQLAYRLKVYEYAIPAIITEARKLGHVIRKVDKGEYYIPDAEEMDRFEKRNQPWA